MVPSVLFMHVHENIKKNYMLYKLNVSVLNFQELISNSPYCLPNDSHKVSLENLVTDQLVIPLFIFLLNSYHLSA